jgi:cytochrome c oxidase assembly factor CtaG
VSLTVHMLEHGALISLAAPVLALAGPSLVHALPRRGRRVAARAASSVARPALAWLLFVGTLWVLHVPAVLDAFEARPLVHEAAHGLLLGVAVLFWLPVLGRPRRLRGLAAGVYLLVAIPFSDAIGAWYMVRGDTGAGVAMLASMLPVGLAAIALTWSGLRREEHRALRWEGYADAAR